MIRGCGPCPLLVNPGIYRTTEEKYENLSQGSRLVLNLSLRRLDCLLRGTAMVSKRPLISSYIRTTWTGRMVSVLACHGNHLYTQLKYVKKPRPRSNFFHMSFSGQLSHPTPTVIPVVTPWSHIGTIPTSTEALPRAELYPISLHLSPLHFGPPSRLPLVPPLDIILPQSHAVPLSSLWTTHPTAIGRIPRLSSLIPDWPPSPLD
jgi:hypothetical protein